jgi:hypothetical protein
LEERAKERSGRPERLLVAEGDAPMCLVALALGQPADRALDWLLAGEARRAGPGSPRGCGACLSGRVEAHLARPGPLSGQLSDVAYLLVEGRQ